MIGTFSAHGEPELLNWEKKTKKNELQTKVRPRITVTNILKELNRWPNAKTRYISIRAEHHGRAVLSG